LKKPIQKSYVPMWVEVRLGGNADAVLLQLP
jgi:hypothetical protein